MTYDRYLYVRPVVGDTVTGRFLFDMGAQAILLDSSFMARNGLRFAHTRTARMLGYGAREKTALYSADTLHFALGRYSFASTPNVSYAFEGPLREVDGLLGATLFRDRIFCIDYEAETLQVLSRDEFDTLVRSGRYERIPFTVNSTNFVTLPLTVVVDSARRRTISGLVHVDTGSPGSLTLNATGGRLRRWKRFLPRRVGYRVAWLGATGGGEVLEVGIEALRVGGTVVSAHKVSLHTESAYRNDTLIGAVGNAFLSRFGSVIFDMADKALYLPRGRRSTNTDRINYSGFRLSRVGEWFVNGLSHHPTGLRNGDAVVCVEGRPIDSLGGEELDAYFCTPDRRYTLTVERDGEAIDIPVTNLNDKTLWH